MNEVQILSILYCFYLLDVEIQIISSINNNHHSVSIYRAGGSSHASDFELPALVIENPLLKRIKKIKLCK